MSLEQLKNQDNFESDKNFPGIIQVKEEPVSDQEEMEKNETRDEEFSIDVENQDLGLLNFIKTEEFSDYEEERMEIEDFHQVIKSFI